MLNRNHSSLVRSFGLPSSVGSAVPKASRQQSLIMRLVHGRAMTLICASEVLIRCREPFGLPAPGRLPPLRPLAVALIFAFLRASLAPALSCARSILICLPVRRDLPIG